jgi:hypothetical protein
MFTHSSAVANAWLQMPGVMRAEAFSLKQAHIGWQRSVIRKFGDVPMI